MRGEKEGIGFYNGMPKKPSYARRATQRVAPTNLSLNAGLLAGHSHKK